MILLVTPPFTQLNAVYPATPYLKGFLNKKGFVSKQIDLSIRTALRLFSSEGLKSVFQTSGHFEKDENLMDIYKKREAYVDTIDEVVEFLQGKNNILAYKIVTREFLPESTRFEELEAGSEGFSPLEIMDGAKYIAAKYIDDLTDFISGTVSPGFGLSKYKESISLNSLSFDKVYNEVKGKDDIITKFMLDEFENSLSEDIKLVGITVPFPGNLCSALRLGRFLKEKFPEIKIVLGGGYCNTELRSLIDERVFEFTDYIVLDNGGTPLEVICNNVINNKDVPLIRTYFLDNGVKFNQSDKKEISLETFITPDYDGLCHDNYLSINESMNPMFKLWSEKGWNKILAAYGCYWHKCAFCDTSLDYICNYKPVDHLFLVDSVEKIIKKTGSRNFHFIDEAIPPAVAKRFALEVIKRNLKITWWGNIRFEKSFTSDLCRLMARSGCIAVTGGFEVVTERLLNLMNKGTTPDIVAKVCSNFIEAGILTHTYLIYAFPTQTGQEVVDALEIVRQFFENGLVHSAYWHRFSLTVHSPIFQNPEDFNVKPIYKKGKFANNDVMYDEIGGEDLDKYGEGIKTAIYNYMNFNAIENPVETWFKFRVPKTTIRRNYISKVLSKNKDKYGDNQKLYWYGKQISSKNSSEKGYIDIYTSYGASGFEYQLPMELWSWLKSIMKASETNENLTVSQAIKTFPSEIGSNFFEFSKSDIWQELKTCGLAIL
ncbi:MAG: radical SAM protein [Candidatus Delongbacteria bacterium]|nr:radical SAM protein [Candidatus Delongbacteria bacterium]MBN2834125.1 radical SAM protein [Candidatus Delongbacteria bacterium]